MSQDPYAAGAGPGSVSSYAPIERGVQAGGLEGVLAEQMFLTKTYGMGSAGDQKLQTWEWASSHLLKIQGEKSFKVFFPHRRQLEVRCLPDP